MMLVTEGLLVADMNFREFPTLKHLFTTRHATPGARHFAELLEPSTAAIRQPSEHSDVTLAALPYSSGTTGLPKGVMLTHRNLLANCYQFLAPGEEATFTANETVLCFLPLYHIYGLNVILNPLLLVGGT